MKKIYTVLVAYIDNDGKVVPVGDYDETSIDITEARSKSHVVLKNASEVKQFIDDLTPTDFSLGADTGNVQLKTETKKITVELLKINTITETDLAKIKKIPAKTKDKVLKLRPYSDYSDLNARTPLPYNQKWEDLLAIDFTRVLPPVEDSLFLY